MKNKFLLLSAYAFLFLMQKSFGQTSDKLAFGIHAGVNTFNIKNYIGDKNLLGFSGGIFLTKQLCKNWGIQPELNFQMQGSKTNYIRNIGDIAGVNFKDKYLLNYINLPVLVKYTLPNTKWNLFAGPQADLLLSAKYHSTPQDYETMTTNIKNNFNTFSLSGTYGIETYIPVQNHHNFIVSARYSNDFTRLDKGSATDSPHAKNYGFTFLVGYQF